MIVAGERKAMSVMDHKSITWAGNIYQKFEAMCLEVEEVMYQDTVKYLENQVETVGSSVKNFYSEVMQDIFSPDYVDPVKVADAELPLKPHLHTVIKKPKVTMNLGLEIKKKKNTEDYKVGGDINANEDAVAKLDHKIDHEKGEATSFCQLRKENETSSALDGVCDTIETRCVDNSLCTSTAKVDTPVSCVNLSSDIKEPNLEISPVTSGETDSDSKKPSHIEPETDTICGSVPDEAYFSPQGRLDNSKIDAEGDDIGPKIMERLDKSKFEDTCVLVEGNDLQFVPQKQGKPNSYKIKFAAQYSAHSSEQDEPEQHPQDLPDSEWELM